MEHSLPLISTLVGSLVMAFLFGMLAHRLRITPMVGYLLAGIMSGPFTPALSPTPMWLPSWQSWE